MVASDGAGGVALVVVTSSRSAASLLLLAALVVVCLAVVCWSQLVSQASACRVLESLGRLTLAAARRKACAWKFSSAVAIAMCVCIGSSGAVGSDSCVRSLQDGVRKLFPSVGAPLLSRRLLFMLPCSYLLYAGASPRQFRTVCR